MTVDKNKALQTGMIPFWNLYPFKCELLKAKYGPIELKEGFPSEINHWLRQGLVRLAPCSSICLLTHPGHEMALPLGVASKGAVHSVYLGFRQEHKSLLDHVDQRNQDLKTLFSQAIHNQTFDARTITNRIWDDLNAMDNLSPSLCPPLKLSSASASGALLTRLVYGSWFGFHSYQTMANRKFSKINGIQTPIELVIGDEALYRKSSFYRVIDLGAFWHEVTGLPFVFAVWQSKGACLNGWRRQILEVGEKAEKLMRTTPASYLPTNVPKDELGKSIALADYWQAIRYRLGPDDFRGLLIFLCLGRKLLDVPLDDAAMVKIMRWQEICQIGSLPSI